MPHKKSRANQTTCEEATKCFDCNSELIGENNIVKQKEVETEKKWNGELCAALCISQRNRDQSKKKWVYRHAKIIKQFIPASFDFNFLPFGLMHSQTAPIHNTMRSWPILMIICFFKKKFPPNWSFACESNVLKKVSVQNSIFNHNVIVL